MEKTILLTLIAVIYILSTAGAYANLYYSYFNKDGKYRAIYWKPQIYEYLTPLVPVTNTMLATDWIMGKWKYDENCS